MLLRIANVFSREQTDRIRSALEQADWQDGRVTAGYQSAKAKHNLQLAEDDPLAREIAEAIFGVERVASDPWKTSALRDAVLDLVKDGFAMIDGGYRKLLRHRRRS